MMINLLLGLPTMVLCLLLQSLLLIVAARYYSGHSAEVNSPSLWEGLLVVNGVMLLLVVGNLAQIGVWALLFQMLDEFDQYSDAFYHSAVNFATLGYGDVVMSETHRLLGPIQALNGVLMIGISTAALMSVFQDAVRKKMQARGGN